MIFPKQGKRRRNRCSISTRFFSDYQDALAQDGGHKAVREVVARAVTAPDVVLAALEGPHRAGINLPLHSQTLTLLNLVWGLGVTIMPHDHRMWAVVGIYTGREDNIFWRRLPPDAHRPIEAAGARSLFQGDCTSLGPDVIHSLTNPITRPTGLIHVYGGDFLKQERSEWHPETLCEQSYDVAKTRQLFEDSNRALASA